MSKVIFVPHGGGPLPILGDPGHADLAAGLQGENGYQDVLFGMQNSGFIWR